MREIKFRAINTKTKRLLSSDNLVYSDGKWYAKPIEEEEE